MYFFKDPDDLLSVLDLRVQSLLLGPKEANEAMYKAYRRLINSDKTLGTNSDEILDHLERSVGGKALIQTLAAKLKQIASTPEKQERLHSVSYEDVATPWAVFLFGMDLGAKFPKTVEFVNALAKGSNACRYLWNRGDKERAINMISELPWAATDTIQWYLSMLRKQQNDLPSELHLPAQALATSAVFRMMVIEADKMDGPYDPIDCSWNIQDMMNSRHLDTGELCAINYFFERLMLTTTGFDSHSELADLALCHMRQRETRQREAKAYRSGKTIPSHRLCLKMVDNLTSKMSERSAAEMMQLAHIACFYQKLFKRLNKNRQYGLDPISPFDDFGYCRNMPEERLKEAMKLAAAFKPTMGYQ